MLRDEGLFLSVCVDDFKMGGKENNLKTMWVKLMKQVALEDPALLKYTCGVRSVIASRI